MRKAHQILAGALAGLVVIQAMAIAYAIAGVFHWIDKDGGVLNSAVYNSWDDKHPTFRGSGGYGLHQVNGTFFIPLVALALLIVSLFVKQLDGAAKRGAILFGMVVLQIILGLSSHDAVILAPLHALNAFGILAMAVVTVRKASEPATAAV
jgi:uncharacterized sodium:solute symporter family permease YidK